MKPATALGTVRVVLVDDSDDLRLILRTRLGLLAGIEVVGEAADGVEGVAAVREHQPDVAILDLGMPRMDGLEAAAVLRADFPDLLLIALTGFQRESLGSQATQAGFDHYFVKGDEIADLEALLTGMAQP